MLPENYHALHDRGIQATRGARTTPDVQITNAGRERLAADVPDLAIQEDETTGLPNLIASSRADARLSTPASSPEDAVREFVQSRRDVWSLTPEDAAAVDVRSVSRAGLQTVRLHQRVGGVEVFDSEVTMAVTPANEVVSVAGQFFPGVDGA